MTLQKIFVASIRAERKHSLYVCQVNSNLIYIETSVLQMSGAFYSIFP